MAPRAGPVLQPVAASGACGSVPGIPLCRMGELVVFPARRPDNCAADVCLLAGDKAAVGLVRTGNRPGFVLQGGRRVGRFRHGRRHSFAGTAAVSLFIPRFLQGMATLSSGYWPTWSCTPHGG